MLKSKIAIILLTIFVFGPFSSIAAAYASETETPQAFFSNRPAKLTGRFINYEAKKVEVFIVYADNAITNEDISVAVTVGTDGEFEASFPIAYPQIVLGSLQNRKYMNIYLFPGKRTDITIDAKDLDNEQRTIYPLKFDGETARTNEIQVMANKAINDETPSYHNIDSIAFMLANYKALETTHHRVDSLASALHLSKEERKFIMLEKTAKVYLNFLDYYLEQEIKAVERKRNALTYDEIAGMFPKGYFDFLKQMPLDDIQQLRTSSSYIIINRLRHSIFGFDTTKETMDILYPNSENPHTFLWRYDWQCKNLIAKWQQILGSKKAPPLFIQAMIANVACNNIKNYHSSLVNARDTLTEGITDPCIKKIVEQRYDMLCSLKSKSYPIDTTTAGGKILSQLVAPYKGKYLMIDFWGITCGPCRAGIEASKKLRYNLRNDPRIDFLFISSPDSSPFMDAYDNYVKEHLSDAHTIYLSKTEFYQLCEYLRFNGIPHYETVTPDGELLYDTFKYYDLSSRLENMDKIILLKFSFANTDSVSCEHNKKTF